MSADGRATRITLFSFASPRMRAFRPSWFAFFLCFVAWCGITPFMPIIREDDEPDQGWLCNRFALPVGCISASC